jgi:hypothetical protein
VFTRSHLWAKLVGYESTSINHVAILSFLPKFVIWRVERYAMLNVMLMYIHTTVYLVNSKQTNVCSHAYRNFFKQEN